MIAQRLKTAGVYWVEDQAGQMGAALAYYTLFSLAPILFIAIFVAGQIYGEAEAKDQIIERIREFIGDDSAVAALTMLDNFRKVPTGIGTAIVGLGSLLFGALSVFTQLRSSLNRIWRVQPHPKQSIVMGVFKDYLLAFLMVQLTSLFVLLLLIASTVLAVVQHWWSDYLPGAAWVWQWGDFLISTVLITLLFAFTYRFLSDGEIHFRHIWGGAVVSSLLFCGGKMLIGWYLGYSQLGSLYGAAGSLVVFLAWIYYSAQIFFFGAELIRVQLGK